MHGAPSEHATETSLRVATLALAAAAVLVFWPLWPALVLAAWTVGIANPLYVRVKALVFGHGSIASGLVSGLLFVILAAPMLLLAVGVWSGASDLLASVLSAPSAQAALAALSSGAPAVEGSGGLEAIRLPTTVDDAISLAQRYGGQAYGLATVIAGAAWRGAVSLIVYFAGVFVFFVNGAAIWRWIEAHSPLKPRHLDRFGDAFHEVGRGLLIGVGLTCAMQGLVATIIYAALGVPRAWVLGPITGVASIIPLVGSALIWGPLAISFLVVGSPIKALVLAGLGVGVISVVDNFTRPMFARLGALKMHILLLFIAIFGGLTMFGAWGTILGPLLVRLAMEGLALRAESQALAAGVPLPGPEPGPTDPALTPPPSPPPSAGVGTPSIPPA